MALQETMLDEASMKQKQSTMTERNDRRGCQEVSSLSPFREGEERRIIVFTLLLLEADSRIARSLFKEIPG
jgi:hypothetical protein